MPSVLPDWMAELPLQQQSVLILATRGPDGVRKHHPCKHVVRALRACVLKAARYGRMLGPDEEGDTFMSTKPLTSSFAWGDACDEFFNHVDELPHHYYLHLAHAAQILSIHYPQSYDALLWGDFYDRVCEDLHMAPESPEAMAARLNDWGRYAWDDEAPVVITGCVAHPNAIEEA